jgi:hypothetical protein
MKKLILFFRDRIRLLRKISDLEHELARSVSATTRARIELEQRPHQPAKAEDGDMAERLAKAENQLREVKQWIIVTHGLKAVRKDGPAIDLLNPLSHLLRP